MAANYIVINSKFKPFSYAEMLQPVQMATLAHQEVENEYAELATKANVWDEMANEQTDPYAYKMYKTYSNDLEEQAGQLAREGLTPASRQNMLRMKQRLRILNLLISHIQELHLRNKWVLLLKAWLRK